MKITTITARRALNTGNYTSAQLEMTATITEEDPAEAAQELMTLVEEQLRKKFFPRTEDDDIPY